MLTTVDLIKVIRELQHNSNPLHFEDAIDEFVEKPKIDDQDLLKSLDYILSKIKTKDCALRNKASKVIGDYIDIEYDVDYDITI